MSTTSQDLNALFKEVYRSKVENLVPEGIQLLKDVPFSEKEKVGQSLQVAVRVSDENSFTFTNDAVSAVSLNQPIPARYLTASVVPTTIVLRAQISYQQAAKAASKKKSIEESTQEIFESLKLTMDRRLEEAFFYGSSDIQNFEESQVSTTLSTSLNAHMNIVQGTDLVRTFPANSFWDAGEDAARIPNTRVSISRAAVFDRTGVRGDILATNLRIKSIANDRVTVTFDTTNANLVVNYPRANPANTRTSRGDTFIFDYALPTDHSLLGLDQLLKPTTGSLYGIPVDDTSGYWQSGTYAVDGGLTVEHVIKAAEVAVPNGLEGRACLYINTAAFNNLAKELDKNIQGFMSLQVPYSKGIVEVKPSIYVKLEDGFLIKPEECKRIGTTDATFDTPGFKDQGPFHRLEGSNGFTITLFTEQALFLSRPSRCVKLTGITE